MPLKRILIIGGTGEARSLAAALIAEGFAPVTSLAGVTRLPLLPEGEVRRGGFGGVEGLRHYLEEANIAGLADASHPFAAQISGHAHEAALQAGVPYLRLERPQWAPEPQDHWIEVNDIAEAIAALPPRAQAMVTIGRKDIAAFFARADLGGVARMIEAPACEVPPGWTLLLARPPFTVASETALLVEHGISHLASKNAGGDETQAKMFAAREKNIPVIMVRRPVKPEAPSFSRAADLIAVLRRLLSP